MFLLFAADTLCQNLFLLLLMHLWKSMFLLSKWTMTASDVTVTVGSEMHPMAAEHYIEWILLQTNQGIQKKWLKPGDEPKANFAIVTGEKVEAAYEFCNLHKLWIS